MKGKKNKPANIIKHSIEVIHSCDIGLQPTLNKKKLKKIKKKPFPKDKDLFVMNSATSSKKNNKKKKRNKLPKIYNLFDANDNIDITSKTYQRKNKMQSYRSLIKKIR